MVPLDEIARRIVSRPEPELEGEGPPRASVAAIFRDGGEAGPELFFIRRAEHPTDPWSGHIAFPGGRHEPHDDSLVATAIRETREEVGIDLCGAALLGRLPDVAAYTRRGPEAFVVRPFVFALRAPVVVAPNREVADTLWVPFGRLLRGEGSGTFTRTWQGQSIELPCIRLEPGQHLLWGMTYRMLQSIVEAVR